MPTASETLAQYQAAEAAILAGQSYRWGDRTLTRANLIEVQAGRREFERKVAQEAREASGTSGPRYLTANFQ